MLSVWLLRKDGLRCIQVAECDGLFVARLELLVLLLDTIGGAGAGV